MKSNYLICYDIKDEKRLNKVFRYLRGIGLHLQYSVFYAKLKWNDLIDVENNLKNLINENEDDIRIYPLPQEPKVYILGRGSKLPEGVMIFIK